MAVVEAADLTAGGGIVLTSGVGAAPTFCNLADRIIIELNRHHPPTLLGMHDIYEPADPPYRKQIPIYTPSDRIGSPIITVDPAKIVGVVETDLEDEARGFSETSPLTGIDRPQCGRIPGGATRRGHDSQAVPADSVRRGRHRQLRARRARQSSRNSAVRDVHRGDAGFGDRPDRAASA